MNNHRGPAWSRSRVIVRDWARRRPNNLTSRCDETHGVAAEIGAVEVGYLLERQNFDAQGDERLKYSTEAIDDDESEDFFMASQPVVNHELEAGVMLAGEPMPPRASLAAVPSIYKGCGSQVALCILNSELQRILH